MKKGVLILSLTLMLFSLKAQDEYQAKASFVYNFTRLIEWPSNYNTEFVIGVFGNSPVYEQLQKITAGKSVGVQKIVVKKVLTYDEMPKCDILYVSKSISSAIEMVQNQMKGKNVLIVGEQKDLIDKGAAISFFLSDDRLLFQISVGNAQKHGLTVSKSLVDMSS